MSNILSKIAAPGQEFNQGFNPGGMADILMGIISGQGTQAGMESGLIPDEVRRANVIPVEQLLVGGQDPAADPGLSNDIGAASDLLATLMGQPTSGQKLYEQTQNTVGSFLDSPVLRFLQQGGSQMGSAAPVR
jgi:hypothetical protein